MTGEITLRGRVLPIGGLKEKTMAAYKAGIRTVIIPKENEPDLDDIDTTVKESITFRIASHLDEVLPVAFASDKYIRKADKTETSGHNFNVNGANPVSNEAPNYF